MIAGILELTSRTTYGMTSKNVPLYLFRPLNQKLSPCIVGCSQKYDSNVLAVVDVPAWSTKSLSRGFLTHIIGVCGDLDAEKNALVFQYSKSSWKQKLTFSLPSFDRQYISGISFNIDPAGCQDIDDVFTIGYDGYYYITIADVAEWMKLNPRMYTVAHDIGQTLYQNGKVVRPLIPFQEQCSLYPRKHRLGVSLQFQIVDDEVVGTRFMKTAIVNEESYTYNDIQKSVHSKVLKDLAKILSGKDTSDPHEWVEALMVFYNIEAGKVLRSKGKGILRVHESPNLEKYKKLGVSADVLAMKSAKYVPATADNTSHWGLNADVYAHATSPIRRFADIVNQFVLKGEDAPEHDIDKLNERNKEIKKYERDLFFIEKLYTETRNFVEGIALNDHRVWVPEWKRIVTCDNSASEGTVGTLHFCTDMSQSTWKKRMIFAFT